jgi:hypothetical protein
MWQNNTTKQRPAPCDTVVVFFSVLLLNISHGSVDWFCDLLGTADNVVKRLFSNCGLGEQGATGMGFAEVGIDPGCSRDGCISFD